MKNDPGVFQKFLDDAVAEGVAPGFQCTVFDRDSFVYNGTSGFATVPSEDSPKGIPFKPETLNFFASCAKVPISLIILHILEKGLTTAGLSLKDLDNHEALVKFMPEFKLDSGSFVTKILEGFEDALGSDGRKVMKLRDARIPITLRMLLTHTAGMAYAINDPLAHELYDPSDGSVARFGSPNQTGELRDIEVPLVAEPNSAWIYGWGHDWLGIFAARSTGRTFRQLLQTIILDPLDIPSSELDFWLPPGRRETMADVYFRLEGNKFFQIPRVPYFTVENEAPEGKTTSYGASLFATPQAYAKLLQAVLNSDTRILSKDAWQIATRDDLKDRGIKLPRPMWKTVSPQVTYDLDQFAKSPVAQGGEGLNLLHCFVALAPTVSGRSEGSFGWGGIANTYFFVDSAKGVGAVLNTQMYPFLEPQVIALRDKLETLVYSVMT